MEREQRRLFVCDQLCEPQRSRLSRTNRSWRPIHHQKTSAITIGGSPFKTLAEAEEACEAMLGHLTR
jgi:hypothetical protein